MLLGMSIEAFTTFHVVICLLALAAGVPYLIALVIGRDPGFWTQAFLALTVLVSVTGFMFPFSAFNPPHVVGLISLIALALAVLALYRFKAEGAWRWIYVVSAVFSFYLNAFVGVVQTFQKVEFFFNLAPTGTEPPFLIAQTALLFIFVALGFLAVKRYQPALAIPS